MTKTTRLTAHRVSEEIDNQLKRDQVGKLRSQVPILVLGPHRHDRGRQRIMLQFAQLPTVVECGEDPKTGYLNANLRIPGNTISKRMSASSSTQNLVQRAAAASAASASSYAAAAADRTAKGENDDETYTVVVESFPCDKKSKWSMMHLSASSPTVLAYVINVADTNEDVSLGVTKTMTKRLRRALAHLLFVCHSVGKLEDVTVYLILTNCGKLRERLSCGIQGSALDDFTGCFPLYTAATSNSSLGDGVQAVRGEFETAVQSYNPRNVVVMDVDAPIEGSGASDSMLHLRDEALTGCLHEILRLTVSIQRQKIDAVWQMDMKSETLTHPASASSTLSLFSIASAIAAVLVAAAAYVAFEKLGL